MIVLVEPMNHEYIPSVWQCSGMFGHWTEQAFCSKPVRAICIAQCSAICVLNDPKAGQRAPSSGKLAKPCKTLMLLRAGNLQKQVCRETTCIFGFSEKCAKSRFFRAKIQVSPISQQASCPRPPARTIFSFDVFLGKTSFGYLGSASLPWKQGVQHICFQAKTDPLLPRGARAARVEKANRGCVFIGLQRPAHLLFAFSTLAALAPRGSRGSVSA